MNINFTAFTTKANNGYLRMLVNEVTILPSSSTRKHFKIEYTESKVFAIWDTGATTTAISQKLALGLKLKPISRAMVHYGNESCEVNVYLVDIRLPNNVEVRDIQVTEASNLQDCDALIGMDIINLGDFAITNANQTTYFSFRIPPDDIHIDYVAIADKIRSKR